MTDLANLVGGPMDGQAIQIDADLQRLVVPPSMYCSDEEHAQFEEPHFALYVRTGPDEFYFFDWRKV